MKLEKNQKLLLQELSNCIRILTADAIETAKSGHPGMPLGMADVMTVLAFKFLKFSVKYLLINIIVCKQIPGSSHS